MDVLRVWGFIVCLEKKTCYHESIYPLIYILSFDPFDISFKFYVLLLTPSAFTGLGTATLVCVLLRLHLYIFFLLVYLSICLLVHPYTFLTFI